MALKGTQNIPVSTDNSTGLMSGSDHKKLSGAIVSIASLQKAINSSASSSGSDVTITDGSNVVSASTLEFVVSSDYTSLTVSSGGSDKAIIYIPESSTTASSIICGTAKGSITIRLKIDTASTWASANPTLGSGEIGIESDTNYLKIGDGSTTWTSLGYQKIHATDITSGQVTLAHGGSGSDLSSASGGYVKQLTAGSNLSVGNILSADLPVATTSSIGGVKPDGTTVIISNGVISSVGGSGSSVLYQNALNSDSSLTSAYARLNIPITVPTSGYYKIEGILLIYGTSSSSDWFDTYAKISNITDSTDLATSISTFYYNYHANMYLSYSGYLQAGKVIDVYVKNNTSAYGSIVNSSSYLRLTSVSMVYNMPYIASFTPSYGFSTSVVITGIGFSSVSSVTFGGTAATSFTINSDTQITAVSPSSFTTGVIAVTTSYGTASSTSSFYAFNNYVENTTSVNTVVEVVVGETETILPGCDLTLSSGSVMVVSWDVKVSQYCYNTAKSGILRLRRTSTSGSVLASSTFGDTLDYTTGDKTEWSSSYTDSSPTDGHYVITVQDTSGVSTCQTWSALRTMSVFS
jgi:hypothetical protein